MFFVKQHFEINANDSFCLLRPSFRLMYSRTNLIRHRLIHLIHHFLSLLAESLSFAYISVRLIR